MSTSNVSFTASQPPSSATSVPLGPGLYFEPRNERQARFMESTARELLYDGPWGSGKSLALVTKLDLMARAFPKATLGLARRRRTDLGATTLPILLEKVISPQQKAWGWKPAADGGSTLSYPNGSIIRCFGFDDPQKARSGEFDAIALDEAHECDETQWQELEGGRLRGDRMPFRQLLAVCNPSHPGHFLATRFRVALGSNQLVAEEDITVEGGGVIPKGTLLRERIRSEVADNLAYLPPDAALARQNLTGVLRARNHLGLWVAAEGVVYPEWDANRNLVARPAAWDDSWGGYPPPSWPRYRGIDFGYAPGHPFVCLWATREPSGRYLVYRQVYYSQRLVEDHAKQIRALEAAELETLRACRERGALEAGDRIDAKKLIPYLQTAASFSDHDAEDRATLDRHGVPTRPAEKDVQAGIQTVAGMLLPDDSGIPRLRVVRGSLVERDPRLAGARNNPPTCIEEEFPRYVWAEAKEGRPAKDEPVKENDHAMDALRYLFHSLRVRGEMRVISVDVSS